MSLFEYGRKLNWSNLDAFENFFFFCGVKFYGRFLVWFNLQRGQIFQIDPDLQFPISRLFLPNDTFPNGSVGYKLGCLLAATYQLWITAGLDPK